jgi:hypothetical protein
LNRKKPRFIAAKNAIPLAYPLSLEEGEELFAPLSAPRRGVGGEVDTKTAIL